MSLVLAQRAIPSKGIFEMGCIKTFAISLERDGYNIDYSDRPVALAVRYTGTGTDNGAYPIGGPTQACDQSSWVGRSPAPEPGPVGK